VIAPKKQASFGRALGQTKIAKLETTLAKLPAEIHKSADEVIHKIEHAEESAD